MSGLSAAEDIESSLEGHRVELTGYCYRMLGSAFEAQDAVQDTMVRAWRNVEKFEGRSSLRSWLYRIATNVCLDMLKAAGKRARPVDLSGPTPLAQAALNPLAEHTWLEPMPDGRILPSVSDPAEAAVARESVRLAFVAALQHLPPRQRAVLILREVLAWKASEVAELLGTSVASVNSALQRARATLAARAEQTADTADPLDEEQRRLLDRYVAAFEEYDMAALTALLREDAVMTMPPFDLWLQGHDDITGFMLSLGAGCAGSRLVATAANGTPAFAHYKPDPDGPEFVPWAVQVIDISKGSIAGMHFFLDTPRWFPLFGLPDHLDTEADAKGGADAGAR
ncbi:sigma-70 family RNA polymerase sigma factor [Streptomyces sp. NPDC052052]|uniref:sigma-70 family RNA polymerase sigma factor n=1 Tax=Streptomyces sp. NPDC052052 TaxID=3154756 RepID=UPI0034150159